MSLPRPDLSVCPAELKAGSNELVWTRQPDGTYQESGSLSPGETYGKVYFEKDGHEWGGYITEKIELAVASIETGIATGPVNKDKYIIRPCPPPQSIAERIRQNQVQDVWSPAERQFLAEHQSDAVALVKFFLPHLSDDVSERRAIKLKARLDKLTGDPWQVIHLSELTPSEEYVSAEALQALLGPASPKKTRRKPRKYTSCLGCGRRFSAKRANNTICSAKCRQKVRRDRLSQIDENPSRRAA